MLEFQLHPTTPNENLTDFFTLVYVLIDDLYKEHVPNEIKNRRNVDTAILTDSEIITISIVGELLGVSSEKSWYNFVSRNYSNLFPQMCDRTRFNRIRRNLASVINELRNRMNAYMDITNSQYRIIDSFPLPVCKFGRARFNKTFRGHGADYGYCPSKKETYYGYKVHVLCTLEGYITDFIVTPASVDDRAAVFELVEHYKRPLVLIGDKGYIGDALASELLEHFGITMIAMKRNNARTQFPKVFRQLVFKLRRRIETSISQLCGQLSVETVVAKSFWGLRTRLASKMLAFNVCWFINHLLGVHHIALIKQLVY